MLTRSLSPAAYGVMTAIMSIVFVVEMLADLGITVFVVRDKHAEEPRYLNTAWTLRLFRGVLSSVVLLVTAPLISSLYAAPGLVAPLRIFSLWFLITGLESMSFPLAIRHKHSRITMYSELGTSLVSTAFAVTYCYFSHDYWGMVYGTLLNRLLLTTLSYGFYREHRPRIKLDRDALREILGLSKFTMPSSLLTMALTQFDKVVFLRLFSLDLLGVYGLAAGIGGLVESLISKISTAVLYPRCAHNFRNDRNTFWVKYYTENTKLFFIILILPAAMWGAAHFVITVLYPARYAQAAIVLQAFMLRAALLALASPAEDLLVAAGNAHVILVGNVLRATWLLAGSLSGWYFFGFLGFAYGAALSGLPPVIYYLWLQREKGMLILKYEFYKVAFMCFVAVSAYFASRLLLAAGLPIRVTA